MEISETFTLGAMEAQKKPQKEKWPKHCENGQNT